MGGAGTGKGSAMSIGRELLKQAGYHKFAATRMSKEMFILNIMKVQKDAMEKNLDKATSFLDLDISPTADIFVYASEFNSFVPAGDNDFLMMLTDLWDNLDVYDNPKITSRSAIVEKPTVNILAANTPHMFNMAFPSESVATGTLSRYILVHANSTNKKLLFTDPPNLELKKELVDWLKAIEENIKGPAEITTEAKKLLGNIYEDFPGIQDVRFDGYNSRRMSHLIKLCLIFAAADISTTIELSHVINANTLLCATECNMPTALGHFGRSKTSNLTHKVLDFIGSKAGVTSDEITSALHREINSRAEIGNLMQLLVDSQQIVASQDPVTHRNVWFVKPLTFPKWAKAYINADFLTEQEKELCNLPTELNVELLKSKSLG